MRMNRRNVLVGLGGIVAGGGALLGTGAFSSVEATREVDINTAGDADALLQLTDGDSDFVNLDAGEDDDLLQIQQNSLNKDAITRANGAIEVSNDGSNDVGFWVEGLDDGLDIEYDGDSIDDSTNAVDLDVDGDLSLDLVFDLEGDTDEDAIPEEITFHADETEHSEYSD